ncbi:MAG: hypothetical protein KJ737_08320 [Proteobacteria bacterium]|nr:hypothetical protein [Pseudomonadota bacterium]
MASYDRNPEKDRRQGPDFWIKFLKGLAVSAWFLMLGILIVLEVAKPEFETFFDRYYHLKLRTSWDLELARQIYYLMFAGLGLSIAGLLIGSKRHRRKTDARPVSLILVGLFSISGIILYKLYFT